MPIYCYVCSNCGKELELIEKISEAKKEIACISCDGTMERIISKTSFRLNGEGWYEDGYTYSHTKCKAGESEKKTKGKIRKGKHLNPLDKYAGKGMLKKDKK